MLALHWKCLVQGSPWILQIPWMMTWFSKSLTRAQLWGQMRSNIQIILRAGVIGGADKGNTLCHSALWEHLGSVLACEDSWFTESIVSQRPGFTDSKRRGWTLPIHGLFRWHCQRHFHCLFFFFLRTLFCLFLAYHTTCRISVHQAGTGSKPWQWKRRILTTRPSRSSSILPTFFFFNKKLLCIAWEKNIRKKKKINITPPGLFCLQETETQFKTSWNSR